MAVHEKPKPFAESISMKAYFDSSCKIDSLYKGAPETLTRHSFLKLSWKIESGTSSYGETVGCRLYFFTRQPDKQPGEYKNWETFGTISGTGGWTYSDIWYFKYSSGDNRTKLNTYSVTLKNGVTLTVSIDHKNKSCSVVIPCDKFNLQDKALVDAWIEPWHYYNINGKGYYKVLYVEDCGNCQACYDQLGGAGGVQPLGVLHEKDISNGYKKRIVYVKTASNTWTLSNGVYVKTGSDTWNVSV
jgi:hypothetical protein